MSDATLRQIDAYLDGELGAADVAEVAAWLGESEANRAVFVDKSLVHSRLTDVLGGERAVEAASSPRPLRVEAQRVPRRSLLMPIAIAATVLIGGVIAAVYTMTVPPPPADQPAAPIARIVGSVIEADGVNWGSEPVAAGDDLRASAIRFDGGSMELLLTSGASVELSGTVDVRIDDAMNVTVTRGRARFVCPRSAVGFAVAAADGLRIVDLGTEFTVDAGDDRPTQVAVRTGSVRVTRGPVDATLAAGQVARVIAGRLDVLDPLPLANASFEQPIVLVGDYVPIADVPGWASEGVAGVHRLGPLMLDDADGVQAAFIAWDSPSPITQTLGVRLGDHASYELTALAGLRRDEADGTKPTIALELRDADTGGVLASAQATLTERGRWTPITLRYTPPTDAPREHRLAIAIRRSAGVGQVQLDAVRLLVPRRFPIEHDTPVDPGE